MMEKWKLYLLGMGLSAVPLIYCGVNFIVEVPQDTLDKLNSFFNTAIRRGKK